MIAAGWLALFLVYLRGTAGTFAFEDGPELLACAATLGNAHEPGYPLLCLLDRLAMLLPLGTYAFRINIFGAAVASGAAVLAGALATSVLRRIDARPGLRITGGVFTAALWGLSDAFWWQAEIGDKYPLLYLLFVAVLWTAWRGSARTSAFVFGLAITHHPFGLFAAPVLGWAAWRHRKHLPLLLLLIALPLSLRVVYPPVRAGAEMNWGDPVTAERLGRYLTSARYRGSLRNEPDRGGIAAGLGLGTRLISEELGGPRILLVAMAIGGFTLWRISPGCSAALVGCAVLNIALAVHTPEKVIRWYGPTVAIIALLAGIGWAALSRRIGRWGILLAFLVTSAGVGIQVGFGLGRNDLSYFYAAHDTARNILISVPAGGVYLGRGDDDLFPLWAARFGEGMRPDVEAVGMGTPVDVRPADAAGLRRLSARVGFPVNGWAHLHWLLTSPRGIPVRYARTGYDDVLWTGLRLDAQRSAGLVAEWTGAFDARGSLAETGRAFRGYRGRSLRVAPAFDPRRPRDEIARDALLQYVHAPATLGLQLELARDAAGARRMFSSAARTISRLTGVTSSPDPRAALAASFDRLATTWDRRGVRPVAVRFRAIATGFRDPLRR